MLRGCKNETYIVDVAQVCEELKKWYAECQRDGSLENDLRVSMIESFEDIILSAIVEED